jgi:LmbE family N-acetylglucosaminyl deacetylase
MDDETLACGGLIAKLSDKGRIHLVFATDGMKSPSPIVPGRDFISPDLGEIRVQESISAMASLGIPIENLSFLRLPEAQLQKHDQELQERLLKHIFDIKPDHIFIPFRYDRHPDHLLINRVVTEAYKQGLHQSQIVEYFVYYRWKLLPLRDIRKYIKPQCLIKINIDDVAEVKRMALDCYKSQTTIYYPWQTRPILQSTLLDEECQNPEHFLMYDPYYSGTAVFTKSVFWIRVAHRLEPFLQRWKYLTGAILKRVIHNNV